MLFPVEPEAFWQQIRLIIREEVARSQKETVSLETRFQTPGLTYKPLYEIHEVCSFFEVTRQTIYYWVRHGKLRPYFIRSRVYFLYNDIQELLRGKET